MYIVMDYDIPKNVEQCRQKLREEFEKQKHVKDIRVIDMLVIKVIMIIIERVWIEG
jgi:NADH dehydrogenase (ubiquinone) 1 alpha subcomplex subunit 6